ncbi:MAG: hypothetical protein GEU86_09090 [Actinophytocola sp.]|nr:hypothetical protein [Actinophytocola sp.]
MAEHRSEQQERMELDSEPRSKDSPAAWEAVDRAQENEEAARQFSPPEGDTEFADDEPTEIAQAHDAQPAAGPEQGAMHVTDVETGGGRVGR